MTLKDFVKVLEQHETVKVFKDEKPVACGEVIFFKETNLYKYRNCEVELVKMDSNYYTKFFAVYIK